MANTGEMLEITLSYISPIIRYGGEMRKTKKERRVMLHNLYLSEQILKMRMKH